MASIIERAKAQRKIIEQAAQSLDNKTALEAVELFPSFDALVKKQFVTSNKGFRFRHNGKLYETIQDITAFVAHYIPGEGTESMFALVDVEHSGTINDPIPYSGNMVLVAGKYYSQDGVIYLCNRDTGIPVYNALADLVGIYVEVV
jgi:hypothetical protein